MDPLEQHDFPFIIKDLWKTNHISPAPPSATLSFSTGIGKTNNIKKKFVLAAIADVVTARSALHFS